MELQTGYFSSPTGLGGRGSGGSGEKAEALESQGGSGTSLLPAFLIQACLQ